MNIENTWSEEKVKARMNRVKHGFRQHCGTPCKSRPIVIQIDYGKVEGFWHTHEYKLDDINDTRGIYQVLVSAKYIIEEFSNKEGMANADVASVCIMVDGIYQEVLEDYMADLPQAARH